jgi:hypothetical protein
MHRWEGIKVDLKKETESEDMNCIQMTQEQESNGRAFANPVMSFLVPQMTGNLIS